MSPFTTLDNVSLAPDTFVVIRTNWPFLSPHAYIIDGIVRLAYHRRTDFQNTRMEDTLTNKTAVGDS